MRRWPAYVGLLAISIAVAFFGYSTYRDVERDLSAAALSGRGSISVLAASTLSQDFQRLIDVGRSLASRVRFGQLIREGRWQEASQIMAKVPRDFPGVEQVLLADIEGTVQAIAPGADAGVESGTLEQLPIMPVAMGPFVSDARVSTATAGGSYFLVVVPVMMRGSETAFAMLGLRVSTQRFLDLFAQLRLERRSSIQVIDRRGQLAFDSARPAGLQPVDLSSDDAVKRMLAGETGVDIDAAADVVAFAPTSFGWGILARWPQRAVFAARDDQLRRVLIACGLFAVMVALAVGLLLQLSAERRQTSNERRVNVELESRVRERTKQLEKANVDLESFSYSVSHDLRAPLRAIDGYVHVVLEEHHAVLGTNAKRCIDNVHRNVQHMSQLIDELLELARVGRIALQEESVDMTALVNDLLPIVLAGRSNISVDVQPLPPACADPTLIRQIWMNLLDNAVKYSSRSDCPQITVSAQIDAGQVTYCVVDNGVGFDMQHYERLFKPFSRLHSPGEFAGTGVGLALVKRIIERHEGRVWAESVPGEGARIFFSLPPAPPAA